MFNRKQPDRADGPQPRRRVNRQMPAGQPSSAGGRQVAARGDRQRQVRQRGAGSSANPAFSYYASRSQTEVNLGREANQNKAPIRRLPSRLQRVRGQAGWLVAAVILAGLGIFQLQLSTTPKMVVLSGSSVTPFLQDVSVYQRAAHDMLNGSAMNRNKLTVDSMTISKRLEAQFPELQEVSVSMPLLGNTPVVFIKPAEPAMVLAARNGSFIIDENGRALATVNSSTSTAGLSIPTVTDQSALDVKLGQQVLPSTATAFVSTVVEQYEAKQIGIQSMVLPAAAGELDVYVAGQPYYVKFNIQDAGKGDDMQQIGTSLAVINKLRTDKQLPGQYIDVRLPGRAYYL